MDSDSILSLLGKQKDFCEARVEKLEFSSVRFKDGEMQVNSGTENGANVRVFRNGCWGFASGKPDEIPKLIKKAKKLASVGKGRLKLTERGKSGKVKKWKLGKGIGVDELVRVSKELGKRMKGKRITNRSIGLFEQMDCGEYYNSNGESVSEGVLVMYGRFSAVGKKGSRIEEGSERLSSLKKWDEGELLKKAKEAKRKCEESLDAGAAKKGEFSVVMDPALAGVFAHEAVGHACEADGIIDGASILGDKMGRKIGSGLITIWDDPGLEDGFGRYSFDEEGMAGKKVELIKKGKVAGRLHSVETAAELGEKPNGHGRSESYASSPVVRMSNTCIEPGKQEVEELMEMKRGLYLKGMSGGSVDPFTGQFMFRCEEAFPVVKGEIGKRVRAVSITGTIMETLLEVDGVAKDFGTSPGFCGKEGQNVRVSDGGPHVRVNKIRVG
ncbi:MAG: TldD/PmbA family protein [bacterium]|nr:TldD/PmbA family protein [bacterium]